MGVESFTVLAILDATDRASAIFDKVDASLAKFSDAAAKAAETARASGASIDESLLQTASGADALDLATSRVTATEAKATAATKELATAERDLMTATAAADEEAMAAALEKLTVAEKEAATAAKELRDAQASQAELAGTEATAATEKQAAGLDTVSKGLLATGAAFGIVGAISVKAAGDFQSSTQHLVTDAGESQSQLKNIQAGLIDIGNTVGYSANQMADAMYRVESEGFHAQQGLDVMRIAAEGAKVGNADLDTVAKTLSGTLNGYGKSADDAASFMNQLIATTAAGDLHMQDLTTSLGTVTGVAASAKLPFSEVGGAIATMTSQNMTAQRATQGLANVIRNLSNPNNVASTEMQQLGIDVNDLSNNLGKRGLTGTFDILTQAVANHTKDGQVLIDTMRNSKSAAQDLQIMFAKLPPEVQKLAKGLEDGSLSAKDYNKATQELPGNQVEMARQFGNTYEKANSFNKLLASGSPAAQTYNAAIAKMLGGATGLNTMLMLTGTHFAEFKDNVDSVADAAGKGGKTVDNWDKIQGTFNQKMQIAKTSVENAGVAIGMALLPMVSKVMDKIIGIIGPMTNWITHHEKLVAVIFKVVGVLTGAVAVIKAVEIATKAWAAVQLMLNTAMEENPVGIIIVAIAALVAGVIYAYNHFKWFRDALNEVGDFLKGAFKDAVVIAHDVIHWFHDQAIAWLKPKIEEMVKWWHQHSDEIKEAWRVLWAEIKLILQTTWEEIKFAFTVIVQVWNVVWGIIKDTVMTSWNLIKTTISTAISLIEDIIGLFLDIITGKWGKAWADLKKLFVDAWNGINGIFTDITKGAEKLLEDAGKNIIKGLINGIKAAASGVTNVMHDITSTISSFLPHSPAKTGPLSGSGSADIAGGKIGSMLADGMQSSVGKVSKAANTLAGAAGVSGAGAFNVGQTIGTRYAGIGGGGGIAAGGNTVVFDLRGSQVMSDRDMDLFVDKIGRRVATRIMPSAGRRIQM